MNPLLQLAACGQSYWLDNLSREKIQSGEIARRIAEEGLAGITSNPAIFNKAMAEGTAYDAQIREAAADGLDVAQTYDLLTSSDVRDACDILLPVYEQSEGLDGYVSIEVSPHLAYEAGATIEAARRLAAMVDRPNCMIKIPGLAEGIPAIEQSVYEGYNVNVTLLFGIPAYEAAAWAYIRGLERRLAEGLPIDRMHSVASFFLSRIDVLCDEFLGHRIDARNSSHGERAKALLGQVGVANARLAYQSFRHITGGNYWQTLADKGASVQRMLWASTSTKNPAYSDLMYVEPLIGADTVNTMPDDTIAAFADHGRVADTIGQGIDEARHVMGELQALGIDFAGIDQQLQEEGVGKFIKPYEESMHTLAAKLRQSASGT